MPRPAPPTRTLNRKASISRRRVLVFGSALALWVLVIVGRLYQLQIIEYAKWAGVQRREQQHTLSVEPVRGSIFDRRHRPLAMSVPVDSVFAMSSEVSDAGMTAQLLGPAVGLDADELAGKLQSSRSFQWVKRRVGDGIAARVKALDLRGIYLQKEMKRFYPQGQMAADVMGFVGLDNQGLAGIEYGLNTKIAGAPSTVMIDEDARRRTFHSTGSVGPGGDDVVLTLDSSIQFIAESALAEAVANHHAQGGVVVVENPATGEVLAMASSPTFDPNEFEKVTAEQRRNRAIQWVYEPGSMFKVVTYSAALEDGKVSPEEMIDCQNGSITIFGHVIHDDERLGVMTVEQALAHSSDVAAIKVGMRVGQDRMYHFIRQFGFGTQTGIELPGEEQGLIEPVERWSAISIGAISIGQEVGVTALQVLTAFSIIANGGVLIPPHVVQGPAAGPVAGQHRVVSERTAEIMRHMLATVVSQGTGRNAQLDGYSAAGKTGTAQKIVNGRYSHSQFVASFVGFAPVDHPAIAVLVSIDNPEGPYHGAEVAAPVFKTVAEQTLASLNVPKDLPEQLLARTKASPAAAPTPHEPTPSIMSTLALPTEATMRVAPGTERLVGGRLGSARLEDVALVSRPDGLSAAPVVIQNGPQVTVPDLSNLAVRSALRSCDAIGLELEAIGSGLATEQDPPAGTRVPLHARIQVWFSR